VADLPAAQANADGTYSRFSWTDGEEQVFIVRNSQIYALTKSSGWSGAVPSSAPIAKFLEYFNNRVFAMNIPGFPNRIQWSARGNYLDWATTQTHGGFLDLYDGFVEPIAGGRVLNDRLVVYRRRSITDMVATGDDTAPFLPQGRVYGLGCAAPWTLQSAGQFHIFLANDWNVYTWDGNQLQIIGTPVHALIRKIIDTTKLDRGTDCAFAQLFTSFKEYWLVFPSLNPPGTTVLIYDYLRDTWTRDILPGLSALYEMLGRGVVGSPGYSETMYPTMWPMLMAGRGADYFLIDERVDGDRLNDPTNGSMEVYFDTPDMYFDPKTAMQNATIERVFISQDYPSATQPTYNLEISIDRGQHFPVSNPATPLPNGWGFMFIDTNVTSNVYRLRFHYPIPANSAPTPSWRSYTVVYVPSGEFFPVDRPAGTTLKTGPDVQTPSPASWQA
jgi:hypothetical protein